MSVEKRGSHWVARFRDPTGKSVQRTFRTKGEAKAFEADSAVAKRRGTYVDPAKQGVTVGELGVRLLATKKDRNTHAWYLHMLAHVNERWAYTSILHVNYLDVQGWIDSMDGVKGVPTIRGAYRALHEVVRLAVRGQLIAFDPCHGVSLPAADTREMLFLNAKQVDVLADTLDAKWPDKGWGLLVRFAVESGCRAGEIGGLRVKHLDLLRHRVCIAVARKTYGIDGKTKTKTVRWIKLSPELCDEMAYYLVARDHGPEARVWTGDRDGPLNHHWFYAQRFKPTVEDLSARNLLPIADDGVSEAEAIVKTLRFHDLRHTCVALLVDQGHPAQEVQRQLGHTSIKTTMDVYGHLFPNVDDRIEASLSAIRAEMKAAPAAPAEADVRELRRS